MSIWSCLIYRTHANQIPEIMNGDAYSQVMIFNLLFVKNVKLIKWTLELQKQVRFSLTNSICVSGGLQPTILTSNYLLPNLANMQVICGVATSQLSHLLSAAPNPPRDATFLSNVPSAPTLTPPTVTFIASLVCSTCSAAHPHSTSLQTLTSFGRSARDEGMMRDAAP